MAKESRRAPPKGGWSRAWWSETASLLVVVFVCGATLMAFEMVGSRILAPTFGNTVFVWGSLIGVFLGALSLGYFVGGRLADRRPSFFVLGMIIAAAGLIVLIVPFYAPACCRWIDGASPGRSTNPLFASLFLFFVPSVLLGMVSPFAVRLQARTVATVGNVAGRLYSLSTLGSIAGTVLATFWMIPSYGMSSLTKALGITLMVVSLLAILPRLVAGLRAARLRGAVGSAVVLLAAGVLAAMAPPSSIPLRPGEALIAEADSAYQHIGVVLLPPGQTYGQTEWSIQMKFDQYIESEVLVERCLPGSPGAMPAPVLKRGPLTETQKETAGTAPPPPWSPRWARHWLDALHERLLTHIRIREPYTSGAKYTDLLHLPLIFNPDIANCLIVGGGGGVVPTIFRRHYPQMTVHVAEIDPAVVRLAERYFGFEPNPKDGRTVTHIVDGRIFIRDTEERFDLVILDAFTGGRPPFHLMTREFLQLVRTRLTPRGVVHLNIISALDGRKGRFFRAVMNTFNDVFKPDHVYVFPKMYDPDYDQSTSREIGRNIEIIATNFDTLPLPLPYDEIVTRAYHLVDSGTVKLGAIPIHARNHLHEERDRDFTSAPLLTDDYAPVDMMVID